MDGRKEVKKLVQEAKAKGWVVHQVGHGVSIHRLECINMRKGVIDEDRRIDVAWAVASDTYFPVQLTVVGHDRKNLLADISKSIGELDCNIQAGTFEGSHDYARCNFMCEVKNLNHLGRIIKAIRKISSVTSVERSVFTLDGGTPIEDSRN